MMNTMTPLITLVLLSAGITLALTASVCIIVAAARLKDISSVTSDIADMLEAEHQRQLRIKRMRRINLEQYHRPDRYYAPQDLDRVPMRTR